MKDKYPFVDYIGSSTNLNAIANELAEANRLKIIELKIMVHTSRLSPDMCKEYYTEIHGE